MIVAGIMSGTSLDGIDVAVVEINGRAIRTIDTHTVPYPKKVRAALLAVSNAACHTADISRLNFVLPRLYAEAACPLIERHKVQLIGCHGQTIYHGPYDRPSNTLQIGDGSVLAELTGIPVVSNFRCRDMAAGGQGAPLVPFVDYLLFRHRTRGRVALNIGGIANLTAIPPSARPDRVIAFDTGPGNMVIDGLVRLHSRGKRLYDRGGVIAGRGRINRELLSKLESDRYYGARPPKSTGREKYGAGFLDKLLAGGLPFEDLVATATALTAVTIAGAIARFVQPAMRVDELIVSGGGAQNPAIMSMLSSLLPATAVSSTSAYGIDPDMKEAVAFAVLAHRTWNKRPGNLPSATGAARGVILGAIAF